LKININLNTKSIESAIAQLNRVKTLFKSGEIMKDLLTQVCILFMERANYYVDQSEVGDAVKEDIKYAWDFTVSKNTAKIVNGAEKAVYVEFGVGIVGQGQPHPHAAEAGYVYNIPTRAKDGAGYWRFLLGDLDYLDLPQSAASIQASKWGTMDMYTVYSNGTKGAMYAYNALIDIQTDLQSKRGRIATEWQSILRRYLK
jgi:hypothetical protein